MLTERLTQLEGADASGQARLLPGGGNRAVVEFRWLTPGDGGGEANLVVTMENGQIAKMKDYRRGGSARRAAGL